MKTLSKTKFEKDEIVIWNGKLAKIGFACKYEPSGWNRNEEQVYYVTTKPVMVNDNIAGISTTTTTDYVDESELIKIKDKGCEEIELFNALKYGVWYFKVHAQGGRGKHKEHFKNKNAAEKYIKDNNVYLARVEEHLKLK